MPVPTSITPTQSSYLLHRPARPSVLGLFLLIPAVLGSFLLVPACTRLVGHIQREGD